MMTSSVSGIGSLKRLEVSGSPSLPAPFCFYYFLLLFSLQCKTRLSNRGVAAWAYDKDTLPGKLLLCCYLCANSVSLQLQTVDEQY